MSGGTDVAHIGSSNRDLGGGRGSRPGTADGSRVKSGSMAEASRAKSMALSEKGDAFDRDDFDPVSYINELFPTEATLVGLDPLIGKLRSKIQRVDAEILDAVRHQSSSGSRARQDLGAAKAAIEELFGKVAEIRRKAEASEVMVQEICRDIRKLDYAKKHLTHTITALRRLAMLVNAVEQLQRATERQEYSEAAHLLEAVQQLSAHFQSFAAIPKVAELGGRVSTLQTSLKLNCMREFELLGTSEEKPNPLLLDRLRSCCSVIDALGLKAREELVDVICRKEMGVYQQIFGSTGETAALERTERRYNWLRKRLKAREEVFSIFPEHWQVQQLLCVMFASITRTHLADILDRKAATLGDNVEALLMAVKATNDFEKELAQRFGGPAGGGEADEEEEGAEGEADDASPASRVRRRYERMFKERQDGDGGSPRSAAGDGGAPSTPAHPPRAAFTGSISNVFSNHLGVYVEAEERALMAALDGLLREESWRPMEDAAATGVLHSASELFGVIKNSLGRCAKYVSRGEALLRLMGAFQRVVRAYGARLLARLPKTATGGVTATITAHATDWHVRLADDDFGGICALIATAEYARDMVGALGRNVAKTVDPPFAEQVDVSGEEEEMQSVVTACLSVLLLGTETRLDAPLQAMLRVPWAQVDTVGDQSDFVNVFSRVLSDVGQRLGATLDPLHFRYFCDKLAASFCPRYYEYIFRCKKLSEAGSQQLLLDTQALKALLLEFPNAGTSEEGPPASLAGFVSREMGRTEALLKVVGSRPENLIDNFFTLMPSGSPADFNRIQDLKVMRRPEQQAVLDNFNKRIGRVGGLPTAYPSVRPAAPLTPPPPPASVSGGSAPQSRGSPSLPAAAPDLVSRFRFGSNTAQGARASAVAAGVSAAAAGQKMRETMAGSLAAMKNLNLGFSRRNESRQ